MLNSFFKSRLADLAEEGRLRQLPESLPGKIDFSSNDYLGLSRSSDLARKIQTAIEKSDTVSNGATGSRLLTGNSTHAEQLEKKLSHIFKAEAALVFNSGYVANLAVLSAIPQRGDTVLYDELVHASIKDGLRLSFATRFPFRHNDLDDLAAKLERARGRIFIVVESIYSMDGDVAPLRDIIKLAQAFNAGVILDEAHSTGIFGENGSGYAIAERIQNEVAIRIYTFGKALGVHGACVAGSKLLIDYLINTARPFIYTTALPPHSIFSIDCAFDYLHENIHLQNKLRENIKIFESEMNAANASANSPIHTLITPGNKNAREVAASLHRRGFDVRAILSPTVKKDHERVRICLHAFNAAEEIKGLCDALKKIRPS